ncbi:MAG: hypothetical protein LBE25_09785 [Arthrobacter sp.]|jgi:hypothetical protein|nr:hypothetical protein [Arthrobacter sp.]
MTPAAATTSTPPSPHTTYVRFQSTIPHRNGGFTGVFGLANGLARDGRLSAEDHAWWRANNDELNEAYPDPSATHPETYNAELNPGAHAWFRASATHLIERAREYTGLLHRYGVPWAEVRTSHPGRIVYEDSVQVVAVAESPRPSHRPGQPSPLAEASNTGWDIDPETLRPRIVDREQFRLHLDGDELLPVLELLWGGSPRAALALVADHPVTLRTRALTADCLRDLHRHAEAVSIYDELFLETDGTPRATVMLQHRGKAHFAAHQWPQAAADFAQAAALRGHADPELLASSLHALRTALSRAGASHEE